LVVDDGLGAPEVALIGGEGFEAEFGFGDAELEGGRRFAEVDVVGGGVGDRGPGEGGVDGDFGGDWGVGLGVQ